MKFWDLLYGPILNGLLVLIVLGYGATFIVDAPDMREGLMVLVIVALLIQKGHQIDQIQDDVQSLIETRRPWGADR